MPSKITKKIIIDNALLLYRSSNDFSTELTLNSSNLVTWPLYIKILYLSHSTLLFLLLFALSFFGHIRRG